MKNPTFILLILAIFLASCSKHKEVASKITYNDSTYIKIIAEDDFDSLVINTRYTSLFPFQPCLVQNIIITKTGIYKIGYRITKPELFEIAVSDTFTTYLLPADTLVIKVRIDKNAPGSSALYYKIDDPIYDYMQKELKKFGCYFLRHPLLFHYLNTKPTSQNEVERALLRIDSLQNTMLTFLDENKSNIPEWFIKIKENEYIYTSARLNFYQNFYFNNICLNGVFPSTNVAIYNPDAILSSAYFGFISDYFMLTYTDSKANTLEGPPRMIYLLNKAFPVINSKLEGDVLRYFNTGSSFALYLVSDSKEDIDIVDQFIETCDFGLNEDEKAFVNQKRLDAVKYVEGLKMTMLPGEKASSFHLKDNSGNIHTLSEFTGKIVYLHFWATWCGPCIKELPSINQLYENIGNKPIVIINVCTDDKIDTWKQIINREKLKGINLICQGNWSDMLQKSYSIKGVPHYTLIDKNGLLIENACKRPSEIYNDLIVLLKDE